MPIHKILPDQMLPDVLKKPIVFGNQEQLAALRKIETELSETTTVKAASVNNNKLFRITAEIQGEYSCLVLAVDEQDARNWAENNIDASAIDADLNFYVQKVARQREEKTNG